MITANLIKLEKSLLFTGKIVGMLVNTFPADEKYPVLKRDNLTIPIQIQLSQKHKTFCQLFTAFLKSRWNFEHFDKKDDAHRFRNFGITDSENVVLSMSKKSRLRGSSNKQHGKRAEPMLKSASHYLYHIHWSLPSQFSWKKSLLLTCQILGLPVNTLAADEKYPVLNRDNLTIPIQMQLSQKQKPFSAFLASILKCRWNFEHFDKKDTLIDFVILKLRTAKS